MYGSPVMGVHQSLVRLRVVCAIGRYRGPADLFLEALSKRGELRVGRWGREFRGRRWLNIATTPYRFSAEGGWAWRGVMGTGFVVAGGLSQLLTDVLTKGIAVSRLDGKAGLDLLPTPSADGPCWTLVRFWAWPTGSGFGRELIQIVLDAADDAGTVLLLQAGNQHLAADFYVPLGFVFQIGEETAKRPWIERAPRYARDRSAVSVLVGSA